MTNLPDDIPELTRWIGALADGELTDAARDQLVDLLKKDTAACDYYLDYMELHAHLLWSLGEQQQSGKESNVALDTALAIPGLDASSQNIALIIAPPSSSMFASLPSVLFSYLLAAVIVGVGLTIAAFTYVVSVAERVLR